MNEHDQLAAAIAALEVQRPLLGDTVVETALAPLRAKLAALDQPATEQRKHVTILFADVQGFTALAEMLDVEEVSTLMNLGWQKLDGAIRAHGGWIDKHIGEAVMALWGVEQARENDAERATRAALAMQTALHEWQQEHAFSVAAHPLISGLKIRVGLHTGPVVLSQVGSRHEYTALGDSVNVAARLEQAAPLGGVLISHATYEQIRGLFEVEAQPPLTVKGKAEPLRTYLVKRAQPRAFWVERRGVEGTRAPLVGRAAELAQLHQLRAALHTAPAWHAAALVGEAGLGKSRLLFEFENQLQGETSLRARADESLRHLPLSLVRDLYVGWFDIREDDPLAVVRAKFEHGVAHYLGPHSQEQAHYLGQMAGFDFSHSPAIQPFLHDPNYLRMRAAHASYTLLHAVSQPAPVVLLLEDLHWADIASLEWLADLAHRAQAVPILVVGTTRPTLWRDHPSWTPPMTQVRLEPLSAAQCQQLAAALVPAARALPTEVLAQAIAQAEGNPYYLEELLKMLLEAGPQAGHLPGTLAGVLQARLERLRPEEQNTLQRAAVVGRVFWDAAVAQLEPEPLKTAALAPIWQELQARELVFQNPEAAFAEVSEFWFKHALLREVAYDRVLKAQRPAYHRRAAEWLIARSGERASEYAGLIAEHYENAGEAAHAAQWHAHAGRSAYGAYAFAAAIQHYQKALTLGGATITPREKFEILNSLGTALLIRAQWAEAEVQHRTSLALAQTLADPELQLRAYEGLILSQPTEALAWSVLAEQLARQHQAQIGPARLARALYLKGINVLEREVALALAEEGMTLARAAHDLARESDHWHLQGVVYQQLGQFRRAQTMFEQSLAGWRTLGHKLYETSVLTALGEVSRLQGDYAKAIHWYQIAVDLARQIGDLEAEAVIQANLGMACVSRKEYAQAHAFLQASVPLLSAVNRSEAYLYYAVIKWQQGDLATAHTMLQTAYQQALANHAVEFIGMAWQITGDIAARQTPPGLTFAFETSAPAIYAAETCFAQAVEIFEQYQMERHLAVALGQWACYEQKRGQRPTAAALRARAHALFEKLDLPLLLAEMEAAWASIELPEGPPQQGP